MTQLFSAVSPTRSLTLPPYLCSSPEHSCPRDTGEATLPAPLWAGGGGAELLLLHSVMSSMLRVRQSRRMCWRTHPVPWCGIRAMESHTPKAWLGPGASQELHRDFVSWTCCLWSSTQQKGKGEMAKHEMPQVTAGGDSLIQRLRAQLFCCWLLCLRKTCVFWDSKGCQEIASLQQGVQAAASPVYYDCLEWTGHRVGSHLE